MNRFAAIILIGLGLIGYGSASAAADYLTEMPTQWRGTWAEDLADCSKQEQLTTITITADAMRFYESGGHIRGAFERGRFEIMVVMDMSGEGQTWLSSMHFTAASDFQYIQSVPLIADSPKLTLYRCPG